MMASLRTVILANKLKHPDLRKWSVNNFSKHLKKKDYETHNPVYV